MKQRRKSLTVIMNVLAVALVGAEAQLGVIRTQLGADVFMWASFGLPIVNLVLREFTGVPVSRLGQRRAHAYYERQHDEFGYEDDRYGV